MPAPGVRPCGAKTRAHRGGHPCGQPAMVGRARCRLHGGYSYGAPRRSQNGLKDGSWTPEARAAKRTAAKVERTIEKAVVLAVAKAEKLATPAKPRGRPPALNADGTRKNKPRAPRGTNPPGRPRKNSDVSC